MIKVYLSLPGYTQFSLDNVAPPAFQQISDPRTSELWLIEACLVFLSNDQHPDIPGYGFSLNSNIYKVNGFKRVRPNSLNNTLGQSRPAYRRKV